MKECGDENVGEEEDASKSYRVLAARRDCASSTNLDPSKGHDTFSGSVLHQIDMRTDFRLRKNLDLNFLAFAIVLLYTCCQSVYRMLQARQRDTNSCRSLLFCNPYTRWENLVTPFQIETGTRFETLPT